MKIIAHFTGIISAKSGVATNAKPNPDTVAKKEPRKMISPAINKLDKSIVTTNPSQSATLTAPHNVRELKYIFPNNIPFQKAKLPDQRVAIKLTAYFFSSVI